MLHKGVDDMKERRMHSEHVLLAFSVGCINSKDLLVPSYILETFFFSRLSVADDLKHAITNHLNC